MRITTVKSARKPQGNCGRCGDAIDVGDPYRWVKPRYGPKRIRCMKPECAFRGSDLTSNDKLATVYSAVESVQDDLAVWGEVSPIDDLTSSLETAAEEIRGAGEEWTESAESIREYFSESEKADEAEENAEMAEEFAGQLEEVKDEIEALEPVDGEVPTKTCPDCGAARKKVEGKLKTAMALPPESAVYVIKARELKPGMVVVDRSVSFAHGHPMHTIREVAAVNGPGKVSAFDQDHDYIQYNMGGGMSWLHPVDDDIEILREDVDWRKAKTKSGYEWYHPSTGEALVRDPLPADLVPACETCGGTGELPLDDPDEWREEAKSMVEDVLQELPL